MIPILEDAQLGNDLDCQNLNLLNIGHMYPVPDGLVDINDPTLYDPRVPPFASITDLEVAATAGIVQSKLSLNGIIPGPWLGSAPTQAAPGNLTEMVARKGVPGGYAAVDSTGKVLSSHVATGAATGTVSSVSLSVPSPLNTPTGPITTSGSFTVPWDVAPPNTWFGVNSIKGPSLLSDPVPGELIANLSASKFVSGMFPVEQLPVAAGLGPGHAQGILPDTGDTGSPNEYIGRDMNWHHFDSDLSYQPALPTPTITYTPSPGTAGGTITIRSMVKNVVLFYKAPPIGTNVGGNYIQVTGTTFGLPVTPGQTVYAYAAKAGYNNSDIASYTVPLSTSVT